MIGQPEIRHLGGGTEIRRLLQPHRNPILVQLQPDIFQVRPDLLLVLHQAVRLVIELLQTPVQLAVRNSQVHRLDVQTVRYLVRLGRIGLLHQVGSLLQIVFLLRLNLLDLLADRVQILGLFVISLVAMAAHATSLAEEVFAVVDGCHCTSPLTSTMSAAWQFWQPACCVFFGKQRPQPVLVVSVRFLDAGGGAAVPLMAGRAAELVRDRESSTTRARYG